MEKAIIYQNLDFHLMTMDEVKEYARVNVSYFKEKGFSSKDIITIVVENPYTPNYFISSTYFREFKLYVVNLLEEYNDNYETTRTG